MFGSSDLKDLALTGLVKLHYNLTVGLCRDCRTLTWSVKYPLVLWGR